MKRDYSRIKKIIAAASVISIAAVGYGAMSQPEKPAQTMTIEYTVLPGDTLWHIAAAHSDDSEDIREVMARIKADSGIDSGGHLRPGQILIIKKELPDVGASDNSSQLR